MNAVRPVLVLEDDPSVAATISTALSRDGWQISTAHTLAEGRIRLRDDNPRVVVVDLGLPDGNGIAFVKEAAAQGGLGIIVVSGRGEEVDRVVGLEVGADDYIAKPFSPREMVARVRAVCRRVEGIAVGADRPAAGPAAPQSWTLNGLVVEPARQRVVDANGAETRLTGGEAGLLGLLLTAAEHLATREEISERVLGRRLLPEQRGVDQLASNLRQKLVGASGGRVTIAGVRGKGYRLVW
jgi:DNA-binding response OmpR family regulator